MVKLFIASTLDGYIATLEDGLDWLFEVAGQGDNGYGDFYASVDKIVMGRQTYDWICAHEKTWAYAGKTCYVLTRGDFADTDEVKFVHEDWLDDLAAVDTDRLWLVGGGQVIRLFLERHLVDELQITLVPILLGTGKALFSAGNYAEQLEFVGSRTYGQFVELHYLVKK